MKSLICAITSLIIVLGGTVKAQIYADFTVSHGGASLGTFRVRLDYDKAPRTCANFIGLATGQKAWLDTTTGSVKSGVPYYDGLSFHRLIHSFMIQGGDPQGNGRGGPGYSYQDEFDDSLRHKDKYVLSMANSGANTNGSQFFVMLVDNWTSTGISHVDMDNKHSIFGEVINDATYPNSRTIIDGFANSNTFPTGANDLPDSSIVIESVEITRVGNDAIDFDINASSLRLPVVDSVKASVAYDKTTQTYTTTFDRKNSSEYFFQISNNLETWWYLNNGLNYTPYIWSKEVLVGQELSFAVSENRFFSRMVEIDYGQLPSAPEDLIGAGKKIVIETSNGESVTLTFDGIGGGSWIDTVDSGHSGNLSGVTWLVSVSDTSFYTSSQARKISLGGLNVTFDSPAGSELWSSLIFELSFHEPSSGWCNGTVVVPSSGGGTESQNKRLSFTWES